MSNAPITVTLENSGLDLFKAGFKGTPEEHRRVEHEIGVVLELIAQMTNLLKSRRACGANEYLGMAVGTVQCAALRHYIDQVARDGYGEYQGIFDAVTNMLGGAKGVADATQEIIDAQGVASAKGAAS